MKKNELENRMRHGEKLEEIIPHQWSGQGYVFKGQFDPFHPEEIIYISEAAYDTASYMERCKSMEKDGVDVEEIEACMDDILNSCFSTQDFLNLAEEYVADLENAVRSDLVAKQLFDYVDWQAPSSALPELEVS